jgi:hypothetical protein
MTTYAFGYPLVQMNNPVSVMSAVVEKREGEI